MISGVGGSGKTALALQCAHAMRAQFDEGQFWVDLWGFSADAAGPLAPQAVLERFLRALGVHPDYMPTDVDEQTTLWRSMIADRRVLIVADNAASARQVRPLLPGSGPAVVVVTTRASLRELKVDGACPIHLGPLDETSSITLLDRIAGAERIHAEPEAARSLIARSGRLPLALWTLGAHLGSHPDRTITALADSLPDLSPIRTETTTMTSDKMPDETTSALDAAYDALPAREQDFYRLLGLLPGHDFAAETVAGLTGREEKVTVRLLGTLVDAKLLQRQVDQRFWFHDRIRQHAYAMAQAAEPLHALRARTERMAEWYMVTAADAQRAIIRHRWYVGDYFRRPIRRTFTRHAALDWCETERYNLLSVQKRAFDDDRLDIASQVPEALWGLFVYRKTYSEWFKTCEIGYAAACAADNPMAQARMLGGFASAHSSKHQFDVAEDYWRRALELEEQNDHREGAATALEGIGVCQLHSDPDQAIAYFLRSLEHHTTLGRPRGVKLQVRHLGEGHLAAGRYDEAIEQLQKARRIDVGPGEEYLTCRELTPLGYAYLGKGDLDRAEEVLQDNRALTKQIGAEHEHANVLVALADLAHHRGEHTQELAQLRLAHPLYARRGAPQAIDVKGRIDVLTRDDRGAGNGQPGSDEPTGPFRGDGDE